jgi:hypothetical protein
MYNTLQTAMLKWSHKEVQNMRVIVSLVLFMGVLAVVPAFSQARTVTNADLEKYRQQRLRAERDYNKNYEKMGFPSPAELQKQLEKSKTEREALSARLTNERLEQERVAAVLEAAQEMARQAATPDVTIVNPSTEYRDRWVYPNNYYWNQYYRPYPYRGYRPPVFVQPGVGNGIPIPR